MITNFENNLTQIHRQGGNVILSAEGLCRIVVSSGGTRLTSDLFLESIDKLRDEWDMTLVVGYRRYFEWIVSAYNSLIKVKKGLPNWLWPHLQDKSDPPEMEKMIQFRYWYKGLQNRTAWSSTHYNWAKFLVGRYHPTDWTIRRYKRRFGQDFKVKLYNMHQEGDIFANFACHAFNDAGTFCSILKKEEGKKAPRMNPTRPIEYDRLIMKAYKDGILFTPRSRERTRQITGEKLKNIEKNHELKYLCLEKEEAEQLLKLSIEYEKKVYRQYFPLPENKKSRAAYFKKLEASHRSSFNEYLLSHKFCNWDVDSILQNDIYVVDFLRSMNNYQRMHTDGK
uniref:Uncharacterized protein n=1 Tax=Corethron hystrix TaxID=216773 RepID=A0A7S1BDD7_9STRA